MAAVRFYVSRILRPILIAVSKRQWGTRQTRYLHSLDSRGRSGAPQPNGVDEAGAQDTLAGHTGSAKANCPQPKLFRPDRPSSS